MTKLFQRFGFLLVCLGIASNASADWPEYRGNLQRTSFRKQKILASTWTPSWQYKLPAPQPSWDNPARGSIWQNLVSIEPRVTDDKANVPLIVADTKSNLHVLVPSSSDDRLVAIDPRTGKINWQIETDGPIRFAPSVSDGVAYFGCDDGFLRAVHLENGELQWKQKVGPGYKAIVGNGRLINPHPIRTSTVLQKDLVLAHAGLFPSQGVYSVALNKKNGELVWRRKIDASSQGYLLGTGNDRVYVPTGRSVPYAIDSENGQKLYDLPSPGGTFCMLTPEVFFTGPGNSPSVESFSTSGRAKMLSFQARHIAAGFGRIWTANGNQITCHDLKKVTQKQQTPSWQLKSKCQNGLLVTGQGDRFTLFAAGPNQIAIANAVDGSLIQELNVDKAFGEIIHLAVSQATKNSPELLVASTASGTVLAWTGDSTSVESKESPLKHLVNESSVAEDSTPKRSNQPTSDSEFDKVIEQLKSKKGLALVVGNQHFSLVEQIAKQSSLHIVVFVDNVQVLRKSRKLLREKGLYGHRVSALQFDPKEKELPVENELFNLVVNLRDSPLSDETVAAYACPGTGLVFKRDGTTFTRDFKTGQGSWRHQYANPQNLSDSKDRYVGDAHEFKLKWFGGVGPSRMPDRHLRGPAPLSVGASMVVQADGALIGVDPANGTERWQFDLPESSMRYVTPYDGGYTCLNESGNELYVATKEKIFCLDAFTGKVISERQIDQANRRWGYLSQGGDRVITTKTSLTAPRIATDRKTQRTFVDADYRSERPLVCSRSIEGWDQKLNGVWQRKSQGVIPHGSIAVDYEKGVVVFVEGRSKSCVEHATDRISTAQILENAFLVLLNSHTGEQIWEKAIQWPSAKNILYTQLTPSGILLTTSQSLAGKAKYSFRMHSTKNGDEIWQIEHDHIKGGLYHGEQVHHPMVLQRPSGKTVLVAEPFFYDLQTGKKTIPFGDDANWAIRRPGHSCGTLSGSGNCLFFRANNPTVLNLNQTQEDKFTALSPSRPGCWINIIPAGGNLLIPEASASCVCKYSLQTSMCFRPIPRDEVQSEIKLLPDVIPPYKKETFKPIHRWVPGDVTGKFRWKDSVGKLDLQANQPIANNQNRKLTFDGKLWFAHQINNPKTPPLPKTITLEFDGTVTESPLWCGLLGAIQDNGSYERGCLLGIHDKKFFLAISTANSGKLTYLRAPNSITSGKRYHLVGTYDGVTMRLYMDGKQVSQSESQSGPIQYDPNSWFTLGAYKDSSELHIMKGSVNSAGVYQGVMSANQVMQRYKSLTK